MITRNSEIKIQHAIAGRIRFKIPVMRFDLKAANRYTQCFKNLEGIYGIRANPKSASLIIRYDHRVIRRKDIIKKLTGDKAAELMAVPVKNIVPKRSAVVARKDSLRSALKRFLGMTFLVVVVFVWEVILKRPLTQTLFSPLNLITTVAAAPLVSKGLEKIKEKRVTLESFLGGSIIAAVAVGEVKAALEILWITSGGEFLQQWISERSRRAIRDILQVTEKETFIFAGGVEESIPVERVKPSDTVVLHTGEKIAVDGIIIKGQAVVDEAPINGRAETVSRTKGDKVFAGTFVRQGVIYVKAQAVGDRTYLARVMRMVEDSLENKAPIEGVADQLAKNLIKTGFAVTFTTLVLTRSLWRAFTVMLVMACPCATILAASTAISAAISRAARRHILIKGGRYLEEVGQANIICFDKTGTLTTNEPELIKLVQLDGLPENDLLQLAFSTEMHNRHPVALAIKTEARKRGIRPIHHEVCEYFLGKGVRSEIHGDEILVGSYKLMDQFQVAPAEVRTYLDDTKKEGLTLIFIAKNRKLLGVAGFANRDREGVLKVVGRLRCDGVKKTAMITGDSKYSAMEMSCRLNFDECHHSVLPEEKAAIVAGLKNNCDSVMMVGDGINDALALAEADIGVAMGAGGSEVAIEAADIALVEDDLKGVVYVRGLSQETLKIVRQNFWLATGSNIIGALLGATGFLSPVLAGMVHITHTLGILANSSRLMFYDPPYMAERNGETGRASEN